MDYQKHYEQLIAKHGSQDKPEGYSERHHILPDSMGGSDDASNLAYLSAKAHFVAHHLLWRWHRNRSMAYAFSMMCNIDPSKGKGRYKPSATVYAEAKRAASETRKGWNPSPETRQRMSEGHPDTLSESHSKAISVALTGLKRSKAACLALSKSKVGDKNPMFGKCGRNSPSARLINVFSHETGELLEGCTTAADYANGNSSDRSGVSRTAKADRTKPSSRSNKLHHKGIYARYI